MYRWNVIALKTLSRFTGQRFKGCRTPEHPYAPASPHPYRTEWGSDPDPHRANSKEEDPTGLLNEGFRYRDLQTGTFLTRDPLGFVDGPNVYAYVRQNPWTYFDPTGLMSHIIPGQYYESPEFRKGFHKSSKTMVPAAGVIAVLPIAAKLGVVGVTKELASEGVDMAAEKATGLPLPATSLTGLAKDGLKKFGKEAAQTGIEKTAKQTKMSREEHWQELAGDGVLSKQETKHIEKTGGKGMQKTFGKELAHPPKQSNTRGHGYENAVPKTSADHRGIQHRYLKERKTGTTISPPKKKKGKKKGVKRRI